jgi:hypothetical protein
MTYLPNVSSSTPIECDESLGTLYPQDAFGKKTYMTLQGQISVLDQYTVSTVYSLIHIFII